MGDSEAGAPRHLSDEEQKKLLQVRGAGSWAGGRRGRRWPDPAGLCTRPPAHHSPAAQEYTKLKSQLKILKKAVLQEQQKVRARAPAARWGSRTSLAAFLAGCAPPHWRPGAAEQGPCGNRVREGEGGRGSLAWPPSSRRLMALPARSFAAPPQALHASTEEIDRLHAANERLTKRVSKMMQDLEDSDGAGGGGGSLLGAIWSGGGGAELQQCVHCCRPLGGGGGAV